MTEEQLQLLHTRALDVLATVGLEVNSPATLELLREKAGYRIQGRRVLVDRALVEECVRLCRASRRETGGSREAAPAAGEGPQAASGAVSRRRLLEILTAYPTHFVDWRDASMKPIAESDLIPMARLVDALYDRGVRGGAPGVPQDVPPRVRGIHAYRIGAEYCRFGGSAPATNERDIQWLYRMDEVMGQPFGLGIFIVNPLRIEGNTLDQLLSLRGRKFPVLVGSMPQMGVSAPVTLLGAFVVGIAAAWGAYAVVREITGTDDIGVECRVWPTSARSLEMAYGSPEMVLGDLVLNQLRRFYNWNTPDADPFHSASLLPDAQASAQRAAFGMAMALAGNRSFRFGGLLGTDLVFSPEQLLLDVETLRYLDCVASGFEFSEEAFGMDAIRRVGPAGSYLDDEPTLKRLSGELWQPEVWRMEPLGSWMGGRSAAPGVSDAVREQVQPLIDGQTYRLDGTRARALDALVSAAERDLLG